MTYVAFYRLWRSMHDYNDKDKWITDKAYCLCYELCPELPNVANFAAALWELKDNIFLGIKKVGRLTNQRLSTNYDIPIRTIENWSAGKRAAPEYVLLLLAYAVFKNEKLI